MARIRSVKPEFWDSPDTIRAEPRVRLLYIAMWNWADDYGIGDGNLNRLISFAFPGDNIAASDFPRLASDVSDCFGVVFYEHLGRPYYWIPTWEKHQRTEKKAKQHVPFPADAERALDPRERAEVAAPETSVGDSAPQVGSSGLGTGEQGKREQGEQGNEGERAPRKRGSRIPAQFIVTSDMRQWAATEVPAVDVDRSTRTFVDYWRAATGRTATKQDWEATWRNWLRRDAERTPTSQRAAGRESSLDRRDRQVEQMFRDLSTSTPLAIGAPE